MLSGYRICDADAHAIMSPKMWEDLPEEYARRRPRAVRIIDDEGLGRWNTGWLIEGRMEPHVYGPGIPRGQYAGDRHGRIGYAIECGQRPRRDSHRQPRSVGPRSTPR